MIISIVIPMYNVEKYICRCLDSCIQQGQLQLGTDYEIICVNDGSKDSSEQKAREYEKNYSGVSVFSQENRGLSGARNTGLMHAQGDYIWFVDADDWIEVNCLQRIAEICEKHKLEILQFCAANVVNGIPERRFHRRNVGKIVEGKECLKHLFPFCAPFSIYRRSFLIENDLFFYEGVFHEDNEFTPRVFYKAKMVEAIDDVLYYVFQNPQSITRTVNPKKSLDCILVMKSLDDFSKDVDEESKKSFSNIITLIMNVALHDTIGLGKNDQKKFSQMFYENRFLIKHLLNASSWVYRLEACLLIALPKHPINIYKFLNYFDKRRVKKQEA